MKVTNVTIQKAKDDLDSYKDSFLTEHGWKYIYNTPGSYWMWEKTFDHSIFDELKWDKGSYICGTDDAIRIENSFIMFINPDSLDD